LIEALLKTAVQEFIRTHEDDDPASLMLQAKKFPSIPMKEVVLQIQSRKKAKSKLPKWFSTNNIVFPPVLSLEQCSSEITAQYKSTLVGGGKMADLTGGMGVDTYSLSQSFNENHYVEQQEYLADLARHNFAVLGPSNIQVHHKSADLFLETCDSDFDLIFIDPARRDSNQKKVFRLSDCEPNLDKILPKILSKTSRVLIKASPLLDIKGAIRDLSCVSEVHVVAVKGEVKELLFIIDKSAFSGQPQIKCVDLNNTTTTHFEFSFSMEEKSNRAYGNPMKYLYEPNAAILKGGAFNSIAESFNLIKMHPNTHLYTSNQVEEGFPGRIFEVLETISLSKKTLRRQVPEMKANITVRNYPLSVDQIRKKSGLKEGGEKYILGFSDLHSPKLVLCQKPDLLTGVFKIN